MVGLGTASSSSSSSSASFGSFDDVTVKSVVKFVCSYGGKILPRYPDGRLRYVGGETRVLGVDRSVPFSDLQTKMGELCGWGSAVKIRCQLPTEDLDALVSVTSDEDLANLLEEFYLAAAGRDPAHPLKIRAFISSSVNPVESTAAAAPAPIPNRCCVHHHQIASRSSGGGIDHRDHQNHRHHQIHHRGHGCPRPHGQFLVHHGNR